MGISTQRRLIDRILAVMVFAVVSLTLCPEQSHAKSVLQEAQVIKVHDGDTVTLQIGGIFYKTRLIGIDAPELNQRPWGRRSKENLIDIMNHTDWTVTVETDVTTHDKYGRLLAYLWSKRKELVNEQMISQGYAQLFTIVPNVKYVNVLTSAEQQARQEKIGIWGVKGLKESPAKYREKHPRKDRGF